jgi:hypothetical protein
MFIFPFKKLIYNNFSAFSAKAKMASAERKDFWLGFYATVYNPLFFFLSCISLN